MNGQSNFSASRHKFRLIARLRRLVQRVWFADSKREISNLLHDLSHSRGSFERKVSNAHLALQQTSSLIFDLENRLKCGVERLETLRADYNRISKLTCVEEEKASALLQQLELTLNKTRNRERVISLILNCLAGFIVFVMGVFTGPLVNEWLEFYVE